MGTGQVGRGLCVLFGLLTAAPWVQAENIRVIKLSEAQAFQMGKVTSRRVVQPDVGAKRLTLNFSVSQDGANSRSTFTTIPTTPFWSCKARRTCGRATRAIRFMRVNARLCRPGRFTARSLPAPGIPS